MDVHLRRETGKGCAKRLRKKGVIPAVIYGWKKESRPLEVNEEEFTKFYKNSPRNAIYKLNIEGEEIEAILKDVQRNPVTDKIIHLDFYQISPERMIQVDVPVELMGEAIGVKRGGILYQPRKYIRITAYPRNIPSSLQVDISSLDIGDTIHVMDLALPEGVKVKEKRNFTIVAILGKEEKEEEKTTEEETEE
ncbi:MAG: 50S ribosomal protein L25 [Deltaproteobacteria bacterium]|nr:50S ribosomal protein L25 [Deltaproteobacteria bacterium]